MSRPSSQDVLAVVLAAKDHTDLEAALMTRILTPASIAPETIRWLCQQPGQLAIEALLPAGLDQARLEALHQSCQHFSSEKIDYAIVPAATRKKRLLICDMDSTIIAEECLDELADFAGLKAEISAITERAMAGELNFEEALTTRVGMLKGLGLDTLAQCYRERIHLNPGAKTLVATMKAHGAHCLLVSGGFTAFTSRVAQAAGFHADHGNTLLDDGHALTGEVGLPILGREAKLERLQATAASLTLTEKDTLAMGDGANDLAMIKAAGLGLAYHAKPIVAAEADAAIMHTDLTTALFYQGYTSAQFVSG